MTDIDFLFEKAAQGFKEQFNDFLEDESYHHALATPLKPPSILKAQHRQQIEEQIDAKEMRQYITEAFTLIDTQLSSLISAAEFEHVKKDFASSFDRFLVEINKPLSEQPIIMQKLLGLSDETLLSVYTLAFHLLQNNRCLEAQNVLYFLTFLAPDLPEFWIALGKALEGLEKESEALTCFAVAKELRPVDSNPQQKVSTSALEC